GAPAIGQLVHDHLAVALGAREARGLELARVVGDELLVTPDGPRQIADARAPRRAERPRDGQPRRVAQGARAGGPRLELGHRRERLAHGLRLRQIEAEQVAGVGVVRHGAHGNTNVRTNVRTSSLASKTSLDSQSWR